jgi:hypothetical protein
MEELRVVLRSVQNAPSGRNAEMLNVTTDGALLSDSSSTPLHETLLYKKGTFNTVT